MKKLLLGLLFLSTISSFASGVNTDCSDNYDKTCFLTQVEEQKKSLDTFINEACDKETGKNYEESSREFSIEVLRCKAKIYEVLNGIVRR